MIAQAQADVALSVAMTTVSTLLAVAATPLLTKLLVGQLVPVSVGALLLSTLQVAATLKHDPYDGCWHHLQLIVLEMKYTDA